MGRTYVKKIALLLIVSMVSTIVLGNSMDYSYATNSSLEETDLSTYSDEYFVAMDEDGNVTYTPIDDVETMSIEEIEAIDNVEYEVILEVEGEEILVSTLATIEEAEVEAEMIQEIIDDNNTVETILEEVGVTTEEPVEATPIEIEVSETQSGVLVDETGLVFSVSSDSPSTQTASSSAQVKINAATQEVTYGVVIISGYVEYTNEYNGTGYTHGNYAPDAAYLGTSGSTYIFKQSDSVGYIGTSSAYVIDYDTFISQGYIVSTYTTTNGKLYHNITTNNKTIASTQMVGYQADYMSANATYYSYDGHYFYTSYKTMVTDYKNGTYANAINASEPYYNYYQYLSQRTTTSITAEQIDAYFEYKLGTSSTSALLGSGSAFVENQNTYGVNALLMIGVSINESDWGNSDICLSKNNIFGHGAKDSDAAFSAYTYSSISACIAYHAGTFISKEYANPKNWKYNGAHLGDKGSGANVKYASDPYWGEKAAANAYAINEYVQSNYDVESDYDQYQIGITATQKVIAYDTPGGTEVYNTISGSNTVIENLPVVIIGTTTYNGETWYKIQSDGVLNSSRTAVDSTTGEYDFSRDYVYMKASDITLVNSAEGSYEDIYVVGDATGDGLINSADYIAIKNHIMGTKTIADAYLNGADANEDGKINSADYIVIKNHIMGTALIQ